MLPIGDDNSSRRSVPVVTFILIVVNVLVFLVELNSGNAFIERWSVVPRRLLANPASDFLTIFTAMFMHGGWLHLLGNMLYLWIFGDNVEDSFGPNGFLIFYLLCGIGATVAQVAADPRSNIPNLGASGAIAGVLASYLVMFPNRRVRVLLGYIVIPMPALIVIGFWFLLQLINGAGSIAGAGQSDGIAYMAHIGGFISGLLLTPVFRRGGRSQYRFR
jgi:membrane associated rhomboid family serine protease